jgi:hypothetical protein
MTLGSLSSISAACSTTSLIGRGLDIAREYGVADLDESGEWVVGDLGRLETHH